MCYILHSVIRLKIQAYLSKKNVANKNTVRKHHLGITYTKGIHNWTPPPPLIKGGGRGRTFKKLSHLGGTKNFARKGG